MAEGSNKAYDLRAELFLPMHMIALFETLSVELPARPWLASEDSTYVTAQIVYNDGGWTVRGRVPAKDMDRTVNRNIG